MINIDVCIGTACYLKGSYHIINRLEELIQNNNITDKVNINSIFCLNNCMNGVSIKVNNDILSVSLNDVDSFFKDKIIPLI